MLYSLIMSVVLRLVLYVIFIQIRLKILWGLIKLTISQSEHYAHIHAKILTYL